MDKLTEGPSQAQALRDGAQVSTSAREFANLGLSFPEWTWDVELSLGTLGPGAWFGRQPSTGS